MLNFSLIWKNSMYFEKNGSILDFRQLLFDDKSILPRLSLPSVHASASALLGPIKRLVVC